MKQYLLTLAALALSVMSYAQPKLVGHRGSLWGVENTKEAFENGAKKGYDYLECDVKVAGDGTYIISHDDETKRLGGNLTIAKATIEQLKAETYTQTRGGVTYTGKICTVAEYLDICKQFNVLPVIELKWATGINNNDQSNLPGLVKIIEEKGFRKTAIILTSMKPCLEYLHRNYPDISLQFLTGEYWANHFDWCVANGIDADIQKGYFDKSTVDKFHEAGLKVNMWTTNDISGYKTFGNYGCDFITTDSLDPSTLPELSPDATLPPNTIDYPENTAIVKSSYTPEIVSKNSLPEFFVDSKIIKAIAKGGNWYILANGKTGKPFITVIDGETGKEVQRIDTGNSTISDIAVTADGILLGCNTAGAQESWSIFKWATPSSMPESFYSTKVTSTSLGDKMAASGTLDDLHIFTTSKTGSDDYSIVGLRFKSGQMTNTTFASDPNYTTANWGEFSMLVTPFCRRNILIDSPTMVAAEYTFDWVAEGVPMKEYGTLSSDIAKDASAISFTRYGSKTYAFICNPTEDGYSARLYDATKGIGNIKAVTATVAEAASAEGFTATGIETVGENMYLYIFSEVFGIQKYIISEPKEEGNTGAVDFQLELLWQNSNVTGNAPQNIDGTNAQQGAAHKGIFYVNNCEEKKLYIFDKTGCIGSVVGGAGWGTACDDAGNVIVRDDKQTGTSHAFLIYPARLSPTAATEPIRLEATVTLTGQTNFISASGDILGKGGYIYMFPNKQSAVNIIEMANGKLVKTYNSEEISLTGSTAGYVIPQHNNAENWLYQVRANGYYTYNGGASEALLAGRSSTTPPSRNNTGGGDYFTLSGHKILAYNSGANYKGGFTVKDMTDNKVVKTIEPIGNLGYETGGNYSTFNWLFAEKIDAGSYYIYQYCPANGMAVYKLYDNNYKSGKVEEIADEELSIYPNPACNELIINGTTKISDVSVYTISGQAMPVISTPTPNEILLNVESYSPGIYIIKSPTKTVKFIKK